MSSAADTRTGGEGVGRHTSAPLQGAPRFIDGPHSPPFLPVEQLVLYGSDLRVCCLFWWVERATMRRAPVAFAYVLVRVAYP